MTVHQYQLGFIFDICVYVCACVCRQIGRGLVGQERPGRIMDVLYPQAN